MRIRFDDFELDSTQFSLTHHGDAVAVEPMVFDLLLHFARHPDQVFSMDELMHEVWRGRIVSDATISSRIKSARQALGDSGGTQRYIQTIRGRGFRFTAATTLEEDVAASATGSVDPDHVAEETLTGLSLLVMPLQHLTEDGLPPRIGDILANELAAILTRIPLLRVRLGAMDSAAGASESPRALHESQGVDFVIDGRLHALAGRIRINTQLLDARTGFQLWAGNLEADATTASWPEDSVRDLLGNLEPQLLRGILDHVRSLDGTPTAEQKYLEAHGIVSLQGWNRQTFEQAITLLEESIAMKPGFAHAPAYLSLLSALGYRIGILRDEVSHDRAQAMAERSLELDGMDSTVLGYAGCALSDIGQLARGIPILKNAVQLNPANAQAWSALGAAFLMKGRFDDAVTHLRHGIEISPLDSRLAVWGALLALSLLAQRDTDGALTEAELACQRDHRQYLPRIALAGILVSRRATAEAMEALQEAQRIKPDLEDGEIQLFLGKRLGRIVCAMKSA